MRVLLRADAGGDRGAGHVMRCLTLGEELGVRGHEVRLMGDLAGMGWLRERAQATGITVQPCAVDTLDIESVLAWRPDRVVVDSYDIPAELIGAVDDRIPVLAIVDGDHRGMRARLLLDQNLGATAAPDAEARVLAGPAYALIRSEIVAGRRDRPWEFRAEPPHVVAVLGGTDPTAAAPAVAASLARVEGVAVTVVSAPAHLDAVRGALATAPDARAAPVTPDLPALLAAADLIVSAAGTSAWDVCTLGTPAVIIAVVDNQVPSLGAIDDAGLALTIDASEDAGALAQAGDLVARLLGDDDLRRRQAERCRALFDGRGAERVVTRLEQLD
jgi:spore coat polysaccharide biosynthesis predicted glycosyltransferase SpsG